MEGYVSEWVNNYEKLIQYNFYIGIAFQLTLKI